VRADASRILDNSWLRGLKDFASGGVAGMAQIVVSHPFDTVKEKFSAGTFLIETSLFFFFFCKFLNWSEFSFVSSLSF
jgi:hypothetical protein